MTQLNRWYYTENEGASQSVYTRDTWIIPDEGTEIWCTAWTRAQRIKPYGDGCHVVVELTVYHCDQFMEILDRLENEGYKWGIDGVRPSREQYINGGWTPVKIR